MPSSAKITTRVAFLIVSRLRCWQRTGGNVEILAHRHSLSIVAVAQRAAATIYGHHQRGRRLLLASLVFPSLLLPCLQRVAGFAAGAPLKMRRSARLRAGTESPDGTGGIAGKLAKSVQPPARGRKRVVANVTADDAEKHHFFDKSQPDKAVPAVAGARKRSSKTLDTVAEKKSSGRRKAPEAPEAKVAATKPAPAKKAKAKAGSPMPDRQMEIDLWKQGHARVAGVDEAGKFFTQEAGCSLESGPEVPPDRPSRSHMPV